MLLLFAILLIIVLVVLVRCIVIVPQSNAYVTCLLYTSIPAACTPATRCPAPS